MLFSSSVFLFLFLPAVLFIYYVPLQKTRGGQNLFLAFVSICFYAWGEPCFVLIMLLSIVSNWGFALLVHRYKAVVPVAKTILVAMLAFNLGVLFVFKYLMFTLQNMNALFSAGITVPSIVLPIGLSFFTFQAISYVVDVYRGVGQVQKNPMNVALYIAFFPQLIAGPIVRYQTIAQQIKSRTETVADFSAGCTRFILGLGKKIILSNNLAVVADAAFAQPERSLALSWIGAAAYTLQIFFDFSGYSDMAIGLGKMFGFHFLENFNYPYISKSISEFWRRWHISLGAWFRDYVYFPLGGSRTISKVILVRNLFVVWFLTGVWHGANWTFIAWGLMYFVLISAEKLTGFEKKLGVFGHLYTMLFVMVGWVVFRADTIAAAWRYLLSMVGVGVSGLCCELSVYYISQNIGYFGAAVLFCLPLASWVSTSNKLRKLTVLYPVFVVAVFLVSISFIIKGAYDPFIYFNF